MMTSPSEPEPVWGTCISCRKRFIAGYTEDVVLSNCCQSCMAGLFRVIEQSPTVLVPLPAATANSVADIAQAAALPDTGAPVDAPRPARRPRPRVRRVPLYEPLTLGLRRRSRRDS
jgi:hypothetical protein